MLNPHSRRALPWLTALSAGLAMAAGTGLLPAWGVFLFKPLTTLLVMAYAWPRGAEVPTQRRLVRLGLLLSLAGDVALMWPVTGFLPGLVAFLLAHLAYIAAFMKPVPWAARGWPFVAYAVVAAVILSQLWPGVPPALRAPVVAYVLCLVGMAAQAAAWWSASVPGPQQALARWAALGGMLFVVSDALLATNKFAAPLPASALWILSSYWLAQWCIASSLSQRHAGATAQVATS